MKSLIPLIVTIWLLIPNEEPPPQQRNSSTESNRNPFSICPHTGIPNRINTGYLPHHPTQK